MSHVLVDESALPAVTTASATVGDSATALRPRRRRSTVRRAGAGLVVRHRRALSCPGATDSLPDAMHGAVQTAGSLADAAATVATALDASRSRSPRCGRHAAHSPPTSRNSGTGQRLGQRRRRPRRAPGGQRRPARARRALAEAVAHRPGRLDEAIRGQVPGTGLLLPALGTTTLAPPFARVDFAEAARLFGDAATLPLLTALAAEGPDALRAWASATPRKRSGCSTVRRRPLPSNAGGPDWARGTRCARHRPLDGRGQPERCPLRRPRRANQHTLDTSLEQARPIGLEMYRRLALGDPLTAAERTRYDALVERIAALESLQRTLAASTASAPRTSSR